MKKILGICVCMILVIGLATGCGEQESKNVEGTCKEILEQIYQDAELGDDFRESLQYYQTSEVTDDTREYILGTDQVKYTDSVYSAPMMSSVAYQCVLLRVEDGTDMEEAKKVLLDAANTQKWVCVEAPNVVIENNGNLILYVMGDLETTEALKDAFLGLSSK